MPTSRSSKGLTLEDMYDGEDVLDIEYSCNNTAVQRAHGTYHGILKVGEDRCVVVLVAEGKPYEAVPLKWVKSIQRTLRPEVVSFT